MTYSRLLPTREHRTLAKTRVYSGLTGSTGEQAAPDTHPQNPVVGSENRGSGRVWPGADRELIPGGKWV